MGSMKIELLKLIEEFKDIFAVELSATSFALLPAMTLTVNVLSGNRDQIVFIHDLNRQSNKIDFTFDKYK